MRNILCASIVLMMFLSCSYKQNISKDLAIMKSRPIVLPLNKDLIVCGTDTVNNNHMFNYVIYSDSLDCTSCIINNLYSWEPIIKYCQKYPGRIKFNFIFAPMEKNLKHTVLQIKSSNFNFPVVVDSSKQFEKLNPHLPKDRMFHTFLLDKNNRVVLVGNPINNQKIQSLLLKILEES